MTDYLWQNADDRPVSSRDRAPLILIVEGEMLLAMLLEDHLRDLGYESVKAARVATALPIADQAPLDAAILDINLGNELSYPIASSLHKRGVPFIFVTSGCVDRALEFPMTPVLSKPYSLDELAQALAAALAEPPV